jgi:hypothetical protein
VECQQISIAGQDQIGLAIQSDFEKLVVFGISAVPHWIDNRHKFGQAPKQPQELLPISEVDVAVEFRACQDVGQLIHRSFGNQQDALVHGLANRLSNSGRMKY